MIVELVDGKEIIAPPKRIMRFAIDRFGMESDDHYSRIRWLVGRLLWLNSRNKIPNAYKDLFKVIATKSEAFLSALVLLAETPSSSDMKKRARGLSSRLDYPECVSHSIRMPYTREASMLYGRGTKFCTASSKEDSHFSSYIGTSNLIVYGSPRKGYPNSRKFALSIDVSQWDDRHTFPELKRSDVKLWDDTSRMMHVTQDYMDMARSAVTQLYRVWVEKMWLPWLYSWFEKMKPYPNLVSRRLRSSDFAILKRYVSKETLDEMERIASRQTDIPAPIPNFLDDLTLTQVLGEPRPLSIGWQSVEMVTDSQGIAQRAIDTVDALISRPRPSISNAVVGTPLDQDHFRFLDTPSLNSYARNMSLREYVRLGSRADDTATRLLSRQGWLRHTFLNRPDSAAIRGLVSDDPFALLRSVPRRSQAEEQQFNALPRADISAISETIRSVAADIELSERGAQRNLPGQVGRMVGYGYMLGRGDHLRTVADVLNDRPPDRNPNIVIVPSKHPSAPLNLKLE